MSLDCICGVLAQTLMALLVVKEQIGSALAVHLHVFQLPQEQVTLQSVHNHPRIPGECGGQGQPGWSAIVTSSIMAYSSAGVLIIPSPNICQRIGQPLHGKSWGTIWQCVFPLAIWGIHLSRILAPVRVHHRHTTSITSNLKIQSVSP